MSQKIIDIKKIKETVNKNLYLKLHKKIDERKKEIASNIILEDVYDDLSLADTPPSEIDKEPKKGPVRITRIQIKPGFYRYIFNFNSRLITVNFEPTDQNHTKYNVYVYARGQEKSNKPLVRFGISNINMIQPLFSNILRAIEQFLIVKKPISVRFVAGEGVQFPPIFHQYIYQSLRDFSQTGDIKKTYRVLRGDSVRDGSAFILKRGAAQSNLKAKSWRPSSKTEEIANITGIAVSTDKPIKPPLGLPGMVKKIVRRKNK